MNLYRIKTADEEVYYVRAESIDDAQIGLFEAYLNANQNLYTEDDIVSIKRIIYFVDHNV